MNLLLILVAVAFAFGIVAIVYNKTLGADASVTKVTIFSAAAAAATMFADWIAKLVGLI